MGTKINIEYQVEGLYNRVLVDIMNRSAVIAPDQDLVMTEHDKYWFIVALQEAVSKAFDVLYCIVDKDNLPNSNDQIVEFSVICTNERQKFLLPNALEEYLIDSIVFQWFSNRGIYNAVNMTEVYGNLKHIALLYNGVARKNIF